MDNGKSWHEQYTLAQWEALDHETKLDAVFGIANNGFVDDQFGTVEDDFGWNAIVTASGMTDGTKWMQSFVLNQDNEGFRTMEILYPCSQEKYNEYKRRHEKSSAIIARFRSRKQKVWDFIEEQERRASLETFESLTKDEQTEFLFRIADRGWAENEWGCIDCIFGWNAFLTTRWGAHFVLVQYGTARHAMLRSECDEGTLKLRRKIWNSMQTLARQANSILVPPSIAAKETT